MELSRGIEGGDDVAVGELCGVAVLGVYTVVIARSEATKQSTLFLPRHGLLRFARNDGERLQCYREDHNVLTLYFAPGSSSFAVHIALHEIGVPFEGKPMSFKSNDLRSPGYLALNPEGKVPTLVTDGGPLTEVAAILYYLAKRLPDPGLLPRDDIYV